MTDNTKKIIEQILAVPRGKVCGYGAVAAKAGLSNGARQVVRTLHSMSEKYSLPWHRIVRADGHIALEGEGRALQITLLRGEGVRVSKEGKIDMRKFGV